MYIYINPVGGSNFPSQLSIINLFLNMYLNRQQRQEAQFGERPPRENIKLAFFYRMDLLTPPKILITVLFTFEFYLTKYFNLIYKNINPYIKFNHFVKKNYSRMYFFKFLITKYITNLNVKINFLLYCCHLYNTKFS